MGTEAADDQIRQDDPDSSAPQGQIDLPSEPIAEPDAPDAASDDTHPDEGAGGEGEPSPLEPGGKRFKQVYARAKDAESKLQELREAKARLEGQLEATRTAPAVPEPKVEPRLTWTQLEAGIADGKITQAQALEYRDETLRQEFDRKLQEDRRTRDRSTTVSGELAQYKQVVPEILSPGTPERQRVEQEFTYLVNLGYDAKDLRTELLACRNVLGDIQKVKERREARNIPSGRSTMQDIAAPGKPKPDAKDPLKDLTGAERKHYQKMIDRGVYKGWSEVKEELLFVPPR